MCGRFALSAPVDVLRCHFKIKEVVDLSPRYNIAPGQQVAALRFGRRGKEIVMLRWGLIPFWARDKRIGARLINARAETLEEKSSFRHSFNKYRCLIPADGFYEWKEIPGQKTKQPYFIRMNDSGLFAIAGLWSTWKDKASGENIESCTIITTDSNPLLADIHPRMPVILPQESYNSWIDPQTESGELEKMLCSCPAEELTAHPVNGLCNNPQNDSPECIREVR